MPYIASELVALEKPTMLIVVRGHEAIEYDDGVKQSITICEGQFLFLSSQIKLNIEDAVRSDSCHIELLHFEPGDFEKCDTLEYDKRDPQALFVGGVNSELDILIKQYVEWKQVSPVSMWESRRIEILNILVKLGYKQIFSIMGKLQPSQAVENILLRNVKVPFNECCRQLAVSESTLRRNLRNEGTSFQSLKDKVRLELALKLLKSTEKPVNTIAYECGFLSQSRFSERFSSYIGISPVKYREILRNRHIQEVSHQSS